MRKFGQDSSSTDRPITSLAALTALGIVYGALFQHRRQLWLRLHEKGGKRREVPCHPELEA